MKRYIKLISLLTVLLICLATATACTGGTAATTLGGAYFLSTPSELGIGTVDETVTYTVDFVNDTTAANKYEFSIDLQSGTYTQHLTNAVYGEGEEKVSCYMLETELLTTLTFTFDGTTTEVFYDAIKTRAYFKGVNERLAPIYSEKTVSSHAPSVDRAGNKSVVEYEYTVKTLYDSEDATVTFDGVKGQYDLADGDKVYEGYNDASYYFDNEMMVFMPRAIKLVDTSSLTFDVIDAVTGKMRTLTMAADAEQPTADLIFDSASQEGGVIKHGYTRNGHKGVYKNDKGQQVIPCQAVSFAISGSFSGSPIKCWYAKSDLEDENCRMIKMEVSAPYSIGTFIYSITDTTTK